MTKSTARKPTIRAAIDRKHASRAHVPTKLTAAQRLVLASAAQCDDAAATLPDGMTEKAAQKLASILIQKGLAREFRTKTGMPIWRSSEEGGAYSIVITKLGRAAVQGHDRKSGDGAADLGAPAASSIATVASSQPALSSQPERRTPRPGSKLADVIALLGRKQGAGIKDLTSATGWLPHTTRAALTGLRKRGFAIERIAHKVQGTLYRIVRPEKVSAGA
jgi:Protein of unknown function (DUF3489)